MGIVSRSTGGGGSGIGALLFDSTLGADAASIDTGANGIAQTQNVLEIWILARNDDAAAASGALITLNNDTGANYDSQRVTGINVTPTAGFAVAANNWSVGIHGAGGTAGYAGVLCITIPGYTQTTFNKTGTLLVCQPDGAAANENASLTALGYRSTAAVTRAKVAVGGAGTVLKAGSRMLILGR
jgi:hypothetical protein